MTAQPWGAMEGLMKKKTPHRHGQQCGDCGGGGWGKGYKGIK